MSKAGKTSFWVIVVALSALVVWASPEAAAGERLVAWVDEPFEINGEVYEAGWLSLKPVGILSPGARLHEFRVDGESRGLLVVRVEDGGAVASRGELTFLRVDGGHLVLESIASRGHSAGTVLSYSSAGGQWYASNAASRPMEVALHQ